MIHLDNGCLLVQSVAELPVLRDVKRLYLDVETQSYNSKRGGDYCWGGDRIAGISVTFDDHPGAWYVPIRHTDRKWNIPELDVVQRWLKGTIDSCQDWVNHNILFDAHFCAHDNAEFGDHVRLVDTIVRCKMIDSDRMSYGLKEICADWFGEANEDRVRVQSYLDGMKSKNFADVPADILGYYACQDVIKNRKLDKMLLSRYKDSMKMAWENETLLTPVLYDMEKYGMQVDPQQLKIESIKSCQKQVIYGDRLHRLLGHEINPNSHDQMYEVLINQFGLPVLAVNEDESSSTFGNPTFDKDALKLYLTHPSVLADPLKLEAVKLLKVFRDEAHFKSLFLDTYSELNVDGVLHPSYNQCVRTGRMSCRRPNSQQLNLRAKALIRARKGRGIISADYSQIEFRLIVHYIQDQVAIAAYNTDPRTDFHSWVASMCGVKRKAAKCLNFGMGFGAGKAKVKKMLSSDPSVMEEIATALNECIDRGELVASQRNIEYSRRCDIRAEGLYNTYHERLPGIKATSRRAADVVKRRGYVFNAYGRERHLLDRFCYKGFNSIVQSCAADVMKDTTVKLAPRYNKVTRDWGYNIFAIVHDDLTGDAPIESVYDPLFQRHLKNSLEDTSVKFSIPIMTEMGFSLTDWASANSEEPIIVNGNCIGGPIEFD